MVYILAGFLTFIGLLVLQHFTVRKRGHKIGLELILFDVFIAVVVAVAVYSGVTGNGTDNCLDTPNYNIGPQSC